MSEKPHRRVVLVDPLYWPELTTVEINEKLLQACTLRHIPIARQAITEGANVNSRRSDYMTPLHIAAEYGDTDLIQLLCDQPRIKIESRTMHGLTPLHTAALLGHTRAIRMLLTYGATTDCKDNLGRYPLHYTALQKDTESSRELIRYNADVNVYDVFHESPLYTSVIRRPCPAMIRLLLDNGASITAAPQKNSLGLLLEAVLFTFPKSDFSTIKLLCRHKASVNITDTIGRRTPLHMAALNGNLELATYLIQCGADLHAKNRAGQTAMDVALMCKNFNIAEVIAESLLEESESNSVQSAGNLTID